MGCYAPVPFVTTRPRGAHRQRSDPTGHRERSRARGIPYKGILYAGVMVQPDGGFQILEFNARFGDPETQVVLPLLESDLADILVGITEARLHEVPVVFRPDAAVAVVMASAGYPGEFGTGYVIEGLGPCQPSLGRGRLPGRHGTARRWRDRHHGRTRSCGDGHWFGLRTGASARLCRCSRRLVRRRAVPDGHRVPGGRSFRERSSRFRREGQSEQCGLS